MLDGVRILAVHHDPGLNGAALLFQSVLEGLAKDYGASISMRFPREGPIVARARELGPVHVSGVPAARRSFPARVARGLRRRLLPERGPAYDLIFANSAASLGAVEGMHTRDGTPLAVYVHESRYMLQYVCNFPVATRMLRRAQLIFTVSTAVQKTLEDLIRPSARIAVVSGFLPGRPNTGESKELHPAVRAASVSGARIIGEVGTMSWYKGTDLFVAAARRIRQLLPDQHLAFVWIGEEWYPEARRQLEYDIKLAELDDVVLLPGGMTDPTPFFESLSLLLLPSREDSWPLVMLEAAAAGVPLICFQHSGGAEQFLASGGGIAVPYLDVEAMAQAAVRYMSDSQLMARDSGIAREIGGSVTPGQQIRKIATELASMLRSRSAGRREGADARQ
jgi:glycosyltransferase involved in cell wall biosynthesis